MGGYYGRYPPVNPNGELKFLNVTINDPVVAAGGNIVDSVNNIAQGVTEQRRVGRKCNIRNIFWRYRVTLPEVVSGLTAPADDVIRVILYQDKQCNGATATDLDILETAQIHSFRNLANIGRFIVLYDKIHAMNYGTLAGATGSLEANSVVREFSMFKKCNVPIEFDSTTGDLTEIRSNNFGCLLVGLTGVAGFASLMRLRFSDY